MLWAPAQDFNAIDVVAWSNSQSHSCQSSALFTIAPSIKHQRLLRRSSAHPHSRLRARSAALSGRQAPEPSEAPRQRSSASVCCKFFSGNDLDRAGDLGDWDRSLCRADHDLTGFDDIRLIGRCHFDVGCSMNGIAQCKQRNVDTHQARQERTNHAITNLPCARRVESNQLRDGSPDLRIVASLRLPMRRGAQWHDAELLPAYSGGTVMDLHHLPRHPRRFSKTLFPEKLTVPLVPHSRAGNRTLAVF